MGLEHFGGKVESANEAFTKGNEAISPTFDQLAKSVSESLEGKENLSKFLDEQKNSEGMQNARMIVDQLLMQTKSRLLVQADGTVAAKEDPFIRGGRSSEEVRDALTALVFSGMEISVGPKGEIVMRRNGGFQEYFLGKDNLPTLSSAPRNSEIRIESRDNYFVQVNKNEHGRRVLSITVGDQPGLQSVLDTDFRVPLLSNVDDFVGLFGEHFDAIKTASGAGNGKLHLHVDNRSANGEGTLILSRVSPENGGKMENSLIKLMSARDGSLPPVMMAEITVLPGTAAFEQMQLIGLIDKKDAGNQAVTKTLPATKLLGIMGSMQRS